MGPPHPNRSNLQSNFQGACTYQDFKTSRCAVSSPANISRVQNVRVRRFATVAPRPCECAGPPALDLQRHCTSVKWHNLRWRPACPRARSLERLLGPHRPRRLAPQPNISSLPPSPAPPRSSWFQRQPQSTPAVSAPSNPRQTGAKARRARIVFQRGGPCRCGFKRRSWSRSCASPPHPLGKPLPRFSVFRS